MELKNFLENLKLEKGKDTLSSLTLAILKAEEVLHEYGTDTERVIESMKAILESIFTYVKENKIEVNSETTPQMDLDHWKNNIKMYQVPTTNEVYLYSLRNALRYLLEVKKDSKTQKIYSFEIIIKTFLLIDSLNLSIDSILS